MNTAGLCLDQGYSCSPSDQFPITALREIKLLKMLSHVNVLQLVEMAIERPKGTWLDCND